MINSKKRKRQPEESVKQCEYLEKCPLCSNQWQKKAADTWYEALELTLRCLEAIHNKRFFHLTDDIYQFVDVHWEKLFGGRPRSANWHGTCKMTLAHRRYAHLFENGKDIFKKIGLWGLRESPQLTNDQSDTEMHDKQKQSSLFQGFEPTLAACKQKCDTADAYDTTSEETKSDIDASETRDEIPKRSNKRPKLEEQTNSVLPGNSAPNTSKLEWFAETALSRATLTPRPMPIPSIANPLFVPRVVAPVPMFYAHPSPFMPNVNFIAPPAHSIFTLVPNTVQPAGSV